MTRIVRSATVVAVDDGPVGRTLVADLVPWNVSAHVSDDGRRQYTETWEPGSLVADPAAGPMGVYDGHMPTPNGIEHGPLIGRVVPLASTPSAFVARLELADTARARDVHALADLVGATVSIEADVPEPPAGWDGRAITRTAKDPARLLGVAIELLPNRGAFPGAAVTAARTQPPQGGQPMTLTADPPTPTPTPDPPTPTPDPDEPGVTLAEVDERIRGAVARIRLPQLPGTASPLARFHSLAEAVVAGTTDLEVARTLGRTMVARALADNVTTDNVGIVHEGWVNQIYGIVDMGRPVINGIGLAQLPAEGMTINWPVFRGDLLSLVAVQPTEKTAIHSVKVSIDNDSADLETYAGGSDISLQLIRRSSPSYLEAYIRIMAAGYAAVTDKAASDALFATVSAGNANFVVYDPAAADPTGSVLRTAVFQASTMVQAATGSPASVVLAGLNAFVHLGGVLTPAPIFNTSGTSTASTLEVVVSGLRVVYGPYLPTDAVIVTNQLAASWREDGPQTINALDVEKLGQNYAVWGMAVFTPNIPAGVVGLVRVAPVTAGRSSKSSDKE